MLSFQDKIKPVPINELSFADKIKPVASNIQENPQNQENNQINEIIASPLRTLSSIPSSAVNFIKGAVNLLNPINTVKTINQIPSEFSNLIKEVGGVKNALIKTAKEIPHTAYENLVPEATRQIISGDTEGAQKTLENDPVGQIMPYLLLARGVAEKTGKGVEFDNAISNVSKPIIKSAEFVGNKAIQGIGLGIKTPIKFGVSQTTGLSPDTISKIITSPEEFTKEAQNTLSRGGIANEIKSNLDLRQKNLSETGTGYTNIRNLKKINEEISSETTKTIKENGKDFVYNLADAPNEKLTLPELRQKLNLLQKEPNADANIIQETKNALDTRAPQETIPHSVKVNPNWIDKTIKEITGTSIKDGKITASGNSAIRDIKDIRALQNLYNTWKPSFNRRILNTNEFLNFREDLNKLSKFEREIGKSQKLEDLSKLIYNKFNSSYRSQIPNLENLDIKFGSQIKSLKELKKGILDNNGNLTDTAINRIANATGKGKDLLVARLEKINPGITNKIRTLKAIEDIQNAGGQKVGTYVRAGGIVGGIATLNPYIITGSILSIPEIAVPILRGIGMTTPKIISTLRLLKIPFKYANGNIEIIKGKLSYFVNQ